MTAECVPESLCAVMNYWGKAASVEELSFYGRNSNMNGMLSTQVPILARQKGFRATFLEGSVGRIKLAIDRGVPPIIGVESGGGNYHCFVVIGYSDPDQVIVCEEYHDSKRLIPYDEVERLWQPAGHLMLELEVSRADELFADGANLEAKGRYSEAALLQARQAAEQEPEGAARSIRQKEAGNAELDLADAFATLAQIRSVNGKHELAVAAWKAALEHTPLTQFDVRAKREFEIAFSFQALSMPAEARRHLDSALRQARDPDLRAKIEAALPK